jgi:5,10-methylenetetrahydrofolate reductase
MKSAETLRPWVSAFNITDSAGANMTMAPIAAAAKLVDAGMTPILQMTGRDRNRLAIQGDLLAAYALGASTVVCMGGDPPSAGDHPDAKPVFDLDTFALLKVVAALNSGKDMMGNPLKGATDYCVGAVVNPGADDPDKELQRMKEKVDAGARFFQTQAVYDVDSFARFMERTKSFGMPVIAGFIVLKSGDMARRLNATLPGILIPEPLIAELDAASDKPAASVAMAGRIIGGLREVAQGAHIMAIGWESRVPAILDAAGITGTR